MGRPVKSVGAAFHNQTDQPEGDSTETRPTHRAAKPSKARDAADEPASTLTVRFDKQGRPLPLSEKNRERLHEAAELLGLGRQEPRSVPIDLPLDDAFVARMFDVLSRTQALIISRTTRIAFEDLHRVLTLTPDERAALREPAAAVLKQRFGRWLAAHQDEAGLVAVLVVIQVRKFDEVMKLMEKAHRSQEEPR